MLSLTEHYNISQSKILHNTGLNSAHINSSNTWFYHNDTHCFLVYLMKLVTQKNNELPELMNLSGLMSGQSNMQRSCFSALHNAATLREFLRHFMLSSKTMPSHRHWIETRPHYVRLYQ